MFGRFKFVRILFPFLLVMAFLSCKKKDTVPAPVPTDYANSEQWRILNKSLGLTDDNIYAIEEDNFGNVWVATASEYLVPMGTGSGWWIKKTTALQQVRKNGTIGSVLDSNDTKLLKGRVTAMYFGTENDLYFGKVDGSESSIVHRTNGVYTEYPMTYSNFGEFFSLLPNDNGLWFGKLGLGLFKLNNGIYTRYDYTNSVIPSTTQRFNLIPINNTDFFINTRRDLLKMSSGTISVLYEDVWAEGMDKDSQGNIWTVGRVNGSSQFQLIKFDGLDTTCIQTPVSYSNVKISDLVVDSHDNVWIATDDSNPKGIFKYNGTSWVNYTVANSPLHSYNIKKLFVDSEGNLWISSSDQGLLVLNEFGTRN
jgi:Two component regulator propeller